MIILLGGDGSGKSRLAEKLSTAKGVTVAHHDMNTLYMDYLMPLAGLRWHDAVLDRFIICELVYAPLKRRKVQYTPKDFHNILMLALIQHPLVILATHIPRKHEYRKEEYIAWEQLPEAERSYHDILRTFGIPYVQYDYTKATSHTISAYLGLERLYRELNEWWIPMWKAGYGCIGSYAPKVLIVAERLGPYNYRHLPFEAGPTGQMMTELTKGIPLDQYTITNWVKTGNAEQDKDLLLTELTNLAPSHVVLMGSIARDGCSRILYDKGIEFTHIPHLGYVNRNMHVWPQYRQSFKELWRKITAE